MIANNNAGRTTVAAAVAASLLAAAGTASAAEPGWYVAGTVSMNSLDASQSRFDDVFISTFGEEGLDVLDLASDLDKKDTGFEFAVGYQVSERFAIEAAYIDLGKSAYTASGTVTDGGEGTADFAVDLSVKPRGPAVSLVGSMPLNDTFSLDGRIGAMFSKNKVSGGGSVDGSDIPSLSGTDSKTGTLVGVGATWAVSSSVAVRLSYTRFNNVFETSDYNQFALGLKFSF